MSAAVASELVQVERRAKVVDLARTGKSYRKIALELDIASIATVARDIAAWAAETRPSAEVTEELRKLQREEILALREKLWARLDDPDTQLAATDRLVKLQEREARLMGLDLERNQVTINVTREALAVSLGWAPAVDVEATEITEGGDA